MISIHISRDLNLRSFSNFSSQQYISVPNPPPEKNDAKLQTPVATVWLVPTRIWELHSLKWVWTQKAELRKRLTTELIVSPGLVHVSLSYTIPGTEYQTWGSRIMTLPLPMSTCGKVFRKVLSLLKSFLKNPATEYGIVTYLHILC